MEDLLALLSYTKQQLPQLEAVSCGAIASDYQRLRVEQVIYAAPCWAWCAVLEGVLMPLILYHNA